ARRSGPIARSCGWREACIRQRTIGESPIKGEIMNGKLAVIAIVTAASAAGPALAQETAEVTTTTFQRASSAPNRAWEIGVGLALARLQVGVDCRVPPEFSIAPSLGASAAVFLTEQLAQQTSFSDVHDPRVDFFLSGGIVGRFDILGRSAPATPVASN